MDLTLKAKVIACTGNIKSKSIPKVLGCSRAYVRQIQRTIGYDTDITYRKRNDSRTIYK